MKKENARVKKLFKKIEIASIYGPKQIRFQAYKVPIDIKFAGIFGSQRGQDCTHIWSLLQQKLQA